MRADDGRRQRHAELVRWRPALPPTGTAWKEAAELFVCAAVLLGLFGWRLAWLTKWPVPLGRDGYYYVLQVQSLLSSGTLYFDRWNGIPLLVLAGLSRLLNDVTLGIKTGAAAFVVVATLATYLLVRDLSRRKVVGAYAATLVALSTLQLYFLVEFLANSFAIGLFALFLWRALRATRSPSTRNVALAAALGLLSAASHASAAVFVCVFTGVLAGFAWRRGRVFNSQVGWTAAVVILGAVSLAVGLVGAASPPSWQWLLWSFKPIPLPTLSGYAAAPEEAVVLLLIGALLWQFKRMPLHSEGIDRTFVLTIVVLCAALTVNPWGRYQTQLTGVMERLALWNWIFMAILSAVLVRDLLEKKSVLARIGAGCVALASFLCAQSAREPFGSRPAFLAERLRLEAELPKLQPALPRNASVVAEHGLQFMITAKTGLSALSVSSASQAPGTLRYWFIRRAGLTGHTDWPSGTIVLSDWLLVPEDHISSWMKQMDSRKRAMLVRANPSEFGLPVRVGP